MPLINKYDGQSIFDLLLVETGGISGIFDFLEKNELTELDIPAGSYIQTDTINQSVKEYFSSTSKTLASSTDVGEVAYGAPAILTINGNEFITVPGGVSDDIELLDQNDDAITPISITGKQVKVDIPKLIDTSSIFSTGQAGDPNKDYWLIDADPTIFNIWGHRFRFCGMTGGYTDGVDYFDKFGVSTTKVLAFPETVCFDMATVNNSTGEVFQFQYNFQLTGNTTRVLAEGVCIAFTTASFLSGWRMPTYPEIIRFFYQPSSFIFEQSPFNAPGPFYSSWCSTDSIFTPLGFTLVANTGEMAIRDITTDAGRGFPVRTANISELIL